MDIILKATAGILIAVVLTLILNRQGKEFSLLLVVFVCCVVLVLALKYYKEIFDFINELQGYGNLNYKMVSIILKAVATALLSEITVLICQDSGNAALGKTIQILSSVIIIHLCLPLFTELLELVETVLEYI